MKIFPLGLLCIALMQSLGVSAATVYDFSSGAVQRDKRMHHDAATGRSQLNTPTDGQSYSSDQDGSYAVMDSELIGRAQAYVRSTLIFSPERARFDGVRVARGSSRKVVCGSVDSLNFGGNYVGYRLFAYALNDFAWVNSALEGDTGAGYQKYKAMGC